MERERERVSLLLALGLGKDAIYADRWDWDESEVENSQIHVGSLGVDRQYVMKL
jgi:hypothetical protein